MQIRIKLNGSICRYDGIYLGLKEVPLPCLWGLCAGTLWEVLSNGSKPLQPASLMPSRGPETYVFGKIPTPWARISSCRFDFLRMGMLVFWGLATALWQVTLHEILHLLVYGFQDQAKTDANSREKSRLGDSVL